MAEMDKNLNKDAAEWVNTHADALYRYALQRVSDEFIAKDLVQETFLAAWRNIDNFTGQASMKTWLFTILKNKVIDHYRKAAREQTVGFASDEAGDDYFFDENGHWTEKAAPVDWKIDYNQAVESKEFFSVLENCKRKLKEIQRMVFSMKYMDGLDTEEICKVLQLTASNYWVLVHRAKVQLRACLEKNWFVR